MVLPRSDADTHDDFLVRNATCPRSALRDESVVGLEREHHKLVEAAFAKHGGEHAVAVLQGALQGRMVRVEHECHNAARVIQGAVLGCDARAACGEEVAHAAAVIHGGIAGAAERAAGSVGDEAARSIQAAMMGAEACVSA